MTHISLLSALLRPIFSFMLSQCNGMWTNEVMKCLESSGAAYQGTVIFLLYLVHYMSMQKRRVHIQHKLNTHTCYRFMLSLVYAMIPIHLLA